MSPPGCLTAAAISAAPWWSEWAKAGPTLLGVIIGAGLTFAIGAIQRRWQHKDKARELAISRGEELLDLCRQLADWCEAARKIAFTDEGQGFVPIQAPIFRIAAIVELYFPELSQQAQTLDNVARNYRHHVQGIARLVHGGNQISPPKQQALREEQDRVELALGMFLEAARSRIRELNAPRK